MSRRDDDHAAAAAAPPPPKDTRKRINIPSAGLYLGSKPTPCAPLELDAVGERRHVLCRRYSNCLTHAAANGWKSFDCTACGVYEELSAREQHADLEGLGLFLAALNLAKR